MKTKKTISVANLVARANFDLLVNSYVGKNPSLAMIKFSTVKNILLEFDGYSGYNTLTDTCEVEKILREYNAKSELYDEYEIQMVLDAHVADLNRIADLWYTKTGNVLPDIYDEGIIKNQKLYTEWLRFSFKYLEEGNWVRIY